LSNPAPDNLDEWTIGKVLRFATEDFQKRRHPSPRLDAELLLAHTLGQPRSWLYAHSDDAMSTENAVAFERLIVRRLAGEPVAYLTGTRGFWSLDLVVTPATLVPRPETERLVELVLERIAPDREADIVDLGTGSGAIALALAHERPLARVLATDASEDALAVARANAQRLNLRNVRFAHGDWCAALGDAKFDVIASNPPYIAAGDPHLLDLPFEPMLALASGVEGLSAIRTIVRDAPAHLKPGGWLLFEHGFEQGEAARTLLHASGYTEVFSESDLEYRERISGGRRP
jgi:release factor glutamine methyltransferase